MAVRTDIIGGQSGALRYSLLNPKVPLIRIRIFQIWIHKPVVLFERCWQRSGVRALQRILCKDAGWSVDVIESQDELISPRPGSLLILSHLQNRGPVVVETAIGCAQYSPIAESICQSHARLNVVVGIRPEVAAKRREHDVS